MNDMNSNNNIKHSCNKHSQNLADEPICPIWMSRIEPQNKRESDIRSEYDRDYARLIHSSAFRRLQAKTQVLGLGESDFHRTRLTHTMEVAQIGNGILQHLKKHHNKDTIILELLPPNNLLGAICLAHDIGHPPFGHGGEVALNQCMHTYATSDNKGFEGNGQTLRLLTKLESYTQSNGINPTRRLLLGILKYPAPYSKVVNIQAYPEITNTKADDKSFTPPKCYHDDEEFEVSWILKKLSESDRELFQTVRPNNSGEGKPKHYKTMFKGLDTSIMELADDISYGLHDFEDSISLKLITRDVWYDFFKEKKNLFEKCKLNYEEITASLFAEAYIRKQTIGKLIHNMIINTRVREVASINSYLKDNNLNFSNDMLRYNVYIEQNFVELLNAFHSIVWEHVISHINIRHMEFKGKKFIVELFDAYYHNPKALLPQEWYDRYNSYGVRAICDYIAGMTDIYATRMYDILFSPSKGSIFDRL